MVSIRRSAWHACLSHKEVVPRAGGRTILELVVMTRRRNETRNRRTESMARISYHESSPSAACLDFLPQGRCRSKTLERSPRDAAAGTSTPSVDRISSTTETSALDHWKRRTRPCPRVLVRMRAEAKKRAGDHEGDPAMVGGREAGGPGRQSIRAPEPHPPDHSGSLEMISRPQLRDPSDR